MYGTITAGAESDIQQLTMIARQMVGRWGMSEAIGPIAVLPSEANGPLLPGTSEVSEDTQQAVRRRGAADRRRPRTPRSRGCSTENRGKLDSLTEALLAAETLDEDDAYRAAGVERESRAAEEIVPPQTVP